MYYRQPRYFGDFHCIGGSCTNICCANNWRIDWTKEEIDKVLYAPNISEELKELVQKTFISHDNIYIVDPKFPACPLLTEDRFCRIQRELGVEYMSNTCMIYPRRYIIAGDACYRVCNMSCPSVVNEMLNDEKSMDLVNVPVREKVQIKGVLQNTPKLLKKHPELKYRGELMEFFYEIISDKKNSIETSLILGALAAQALTKLVENEDYNAIPDAIKEIRSQLHNAAQLKKIDEIKPNYSIKLRAAVEISKAISTKISIPAFLIKSDGTLNIEMYLQGELRLLKTFVDRQFFLRNIALNLLLEFALPFRLPNRTIFENYSAFVTAFALFKLNVISAAELAELEPKPRIVSSNSSINATVVTNVGASAEKYVNKSAALINRNVSHNDNNIIKMIDELEERKFTSPAYLALLIK